MKQNDVETTRPNYIWETTIIYFPFELDNCNQIDTISMHRSKMSSGSVFAVIDFDFSTAAFFTAIAEVVQYKEEL